MPSQVLGVLAVLLEGGVVESVRKIMADVSGHFLKT